MDNDLFYVEDIHFLTNESNLAEVVLHPVNDLDGAIIVQVSNNQLLYLNSRGEPIPVTENSYVYYKPNQPNIFVNGNLSSFARRMRALASIYKRQINQNNENTVEEFENASNYNLRPDMIVRSYHVNIGHGNCSLILICCGIFYHLWMVDCSIYDNLSKTNHSSNLEDCLSQIAALLQVDKATLRIDCFMLTHTHYDHYSGLEYLFAQNYVNNRTLFYANTNYGCVSPTWVHVLKLLATNGCRVVQPIRNNQRTVRRILYPILPQVCKNSMCVTGNEMIVPKVNNSSVVYCLEIAGKTMILPGDLEQAGIKDMVSGCSCSPEYNYANYYCVSHHASDNGHINSSCTGTKVCPNILTCIQNNLSYAIVMGRDHAFNGIYSTRVINDFGQSVIYSEKDTTNQPIHFFELDWITNSVNYY